MTREEAIAHGKEQLEIFGGEHRDFIEMAIKALEQEPCEDWYDVPSDEMTLEQARQAVKDLRKKLAEYLEQEPCDDAISRQALCEYALNQKDKSITPNDIMRFPSVTPQPKTGRWIDDKCSACGKGIEDLIDSSEWYRNEIPHFCPFCGLKLVEPQESDLGDYPDSIHDQFDNMTGSMNV